jgi:hypothetical protein
VTGIALRGIVLLGACSKFGSVAIGLRASGREAFGPSMTKTTCSRNHRDALAFRVHVTGSNEMNAIIYLVGLVVIVMFILSLLGLR